MQCVFRVFKCSVLANHWQLLRPIVQGRQQFWRVVEKDSASGSIDAPCVFLSWEWVYQGVSQRGISTECWVCFNAQSCVVCAHVFVLMLIFYVSLP